MADCVTDINGEITFQLPVRLLHGRGSIDRIGELTRELGGHSILIVTDPGVAAAGHAARAESILAAAGLRCTVFDEVRENPTTADVDRCLATAREFKPDAFLAIGGGSSMDAAKGCNFLLTNGGRMHDYWGYGKTTQPMLPLIAVPTTAGTGSEVQSYALISDDGTKRKMACGDPRALAVAAVLDPELAVSQPHFVSACTGLDTIAHAVETAVTTRRNAVSALFSRESFRLAHAALPRVLEHPGDYDAQGDMMLAAAFGGIAIEHSMLGIAHSMANPLTAMFDVAHGQAVGMMLPHVIRFNAALDAARLEYEQLARAAGIEPTVEQLATTVRSLYLATGLPATLAKCSVPADAVDALAEGAAEQWTAQFNPRSAETADFESMYRAAHA